MRRWPTPPCAGGREDWDARSAALKTFEVADLPFTYITSIKQECRVLVLVPDRLPPPLPVSHRRRRPIGAQRILSPGNRPGLLSLPLNRGAHPSPEGLPLSWIQEVPRSFLPMAMMLSLLEDG